ncbi:TonB-dependent receptor [Marinicauda salina]|uniref:TonB-dependent receptor n=1 Tax=Marinicauda salina TaxID=2135793 RepID=A0A2U2BQV3_9PROT|nr:TonB-dependent receptor [Marinicauda salina]PWE16385.1 TonB-dependent receptor [Marinicauda salina]
MKRFTKSAALGATALAAGLVSTAAQAQVEVITVTAQKREQTLQETPVSVAVVSDTQLQQSQIRDAADLQTLVPSLRVAEFAASTNTEFALRGVGTSSFNPGLEPSVGVFVDGVYRPRTGAAINDFLSLERVEVIRGPQSTLFGRNTPAGVVSFITKEPEFELGGDAELTFGNYGQFVAKGTVTGPLVEDRLAFRLDATTHSNDGYLTNVPDGRDMNNRDRQNYRGQLLFTPNANTRIRFIADYGEIDENCCAAPFAYYDPVDLAALVGLGGTAVPPNPHGGFIAVDGDVNTMLETAGASVQLDHEFENFTFTSITAYRTYDEDQNIDADFSDLDLVSRRPIGQDYNSFTQEFRLTSTGDNRIDWMTGFFFYDNELEFSNATPYGVDSRTFFDAASAPQVAPIVSALGLPAGTGGVTLLEAFLNSNNATGVGTLAPLPSGNPALPLVPAEGYVDTTHGLIGEQYGYDTQSWSVFGQLDFNITDRFTFTVGGRYSEEDKHMSSDVNVYDPISAFSFADLGQDLRLVSPTTCLNPAVGDSCAYLVPSLLFGQAQAEALGGDPTLLNTLTALGISPTTPLTDAQASNPDLNPLLGFRAFQNFPPVNSSDFPTDRSDDNFSWNAIASYDVTNNLNLYASYSTGYKPGGFNISYNAAFTGAFEFQEETAESWEIGAKGSLLENTLTYAITYFDQEIEDFQSNNFVGNGFALENAGSIQVSGLEFEGFWAPTDRLFFTGGFTYLFESKYGDYPFAPCPDDFDASDPFFQLCVPGNERTNPFGVTALFNDLSGDDRGNSEFVGSITGTYVHPIGDNMEAFIRGEARHTSEYALTTGLDPRPFANQDDFTLYNASVGIGAADEAWQLQLWSRNITDEEYAKGGFPSVGYLGTSFNQYPGDPMTYGLTLRVRY